MTRHFPVWLVLGLCCLPPAGQSAVIRGTLHGPSATAVEPTATATRTGVRKVRGGQVPARTARGAATDAVVYVEQVPAAAESALAAGAMPATLAQIDFAFVPRVLSIAAGDTVDLPNFDNVFHNVFSLSPTKNFDLGRLGRGQSGRVVFERPGLVNVYCSLHSSMAAFVLVLPHHVFARPDSTGVFALPPLPPGHYTVCVWHPDLRGLRREVRLEDTSDLVLDLSL